MGIPKFALHGQSHVNVLVHVNEKRTRIQGHRVAELRWQKCPFGHVYEQVHEHVHVEPLDVRFVLARTRSTSASYRLRCLHNPDSGPTSSHTPSH